MKPSHDDIKRRVIMGWVKQRPLRIRLWLTNK